MPLFVLEIGTEEIPARFLHNQGAELHTRFAAGLKEAGLPYDSIDVMGTPRRAVVIITGVAQTQRVREETVTGPPLRAAWDQNGQPTKALEGFARTHAVAAAEVFTVQTDKGEYCAVHKRTGGGTAAQVLSALCPAVIAALPFAKRMRWGSHSFAYARPLRWLLALLDDTVIPFTLGPLSAGRITHGHRVHSQGAIEVAHAEQYLTIIRKQGCVEPDAARRRASIQREGNSAAAAVGGTVLWQESLLDEVQGLCEYPVPLLGSFNADFLQIPSQVLLTSMQSHQKSFGVCDAHGALLPYFLTVCNMRPQDPELVRAGWERVLRARLEDARFFWRSDLEAGLDVWLDRLDKVIYLGPLGSMGDKTRRLEKLCAWLAAQCGAGVPTAARAGRLSKADLVSGMVGEFDTLQGLMGSLYAAHWEEPPAVAQALGEQYLPAGPDSPLPQTVYGAILSIADKLDTLVGCFGLGMIPTGTADPNGLRRCVLGITRCIGDFDMRLNMRECCIQALSLYGERAWKLSPDETLAKVEEFFVGRLKPYFVGLGHDAALVDAALGADANDVRAAALRLAALQALHASQRYGETVQTFKRVANIVRKQGQGVALTGAFDPALVQEDAEKALVATLERILPLFDDMWDRDDFTALFALLAQARPTVDAFFDGVMVMCEDANMRVNRLNMLYALAGRFGRLADFSALPG